MVHGNDGNTHILQGLVKHKHIMNKSCYGTRMEFTKPLTSPLNFSYMSYLYVIPSRSLVTQIFEDRGLKNPAMWIAGPIRFCSYQSNWSRNSGVDMTF